MLSHQLAVHLYIGWNGTEEFIMKKALVSLLVVCSIFCLVACSKKADTTSTTATTTTTTTTSAPAATPAAEVKTEAPATKQAQTYKFGMGIVFDDSQSNETTAAYDAIVAVVVTDANGKIVACQIDDAQNKMSTTDVDPDKQFLSKYELQYDYNMVKYSEATNEWFQQVDAFEDYVVGKTADEVAAMQTRVRGADEPHPGYVVTADETLFASCSIQITEFVEAVVKACNDAKGKTFSTADEFTVGVAINSTADESTAATEDTDGSIKMYAEFAGAVVGKDGKILAALTDAIQPQFTVDVDGEITGKTWRGTKKELEYDYNMVKYSEATNEWFQQAAAFEDYCAGKTAAEVASLPTRVRGAEEAHPGYVVTTDETLFASCSIQITGMMDVIAKAANNAN